MLPEAVNYTEKYIEKHSLKWFLYVLYCTDNKYYIGISYSIIKRLKHHFNCKKQGAVFTKIYPPIKCLELFELPTESRDEAELYENYKTIEYAIKYGTDNVAGGNFIVRDTNSRKRGIDNAIKKNKLIVHGKEYRVNDETISLKLAECKISQLYGLSPEEISNDIILKKGTLIPSPVQYLSFSEVSAMIEHIDCLKHKTVIAMSLIYKNKISRTVKIKFEDINRVDMTIIIPRKHNKCLISPMEQGLLDLIEKYYKSEKIKPKEYLFGTRPSGIYWYDAGVQKILNEIKVANYEKII